MVSVAMTTYNGEKYVKAQIESILANLRKEDELVISDDGSTDGTGEILSEYAKRDGRIRLIKGPGRGVIANVEHALLSCRGNYLFLSDQDDIWRKDKVASVLAAFRRKNAMLVMHDARVTKADGRTVRMPSFFAYRHSRAGAAYNIIKNTYMGCCMAFRREALSVVLPIPRQIPMHDQWIGVMCDLKFRRTYLLAEKLLIYRRHDTAVSDFSRNPPGIMIKNRLIFLCELGRRRKGTREK